MRNELSQPLKLHFFSTSRFYYDGEGKLRTYGALFRPDYWEPFLSHFSEIVVYARVSDGDVDNGGREFDIPGITIVPLPYYRGALDYVRKSRRIHRFVSAQVRGTGDFYGLWLPTPFAHVLAKRASRVSAPLLALAIGDPRGVAESIFVGPVAKVLAWQSSRAMRKTMLLSDAAVYVTFQTLQARYPTRPGVPTLALSDVRFPDIASRKYEDFGRGSSLRRRISLIAVGSQEQNYKGHDLLIDAVAKLRGEGYDLSLTLVGQGALHEGLVDQAARGKVDDIQFLEHLGDFNAVALEVAKHDIFVMPSRTEGMPKALLEAMSVGVFAIGSTAGGIPEVLDTECLFESGSADAIADRLRHFLIDTERIRDALERQRQTIDSIKESYSGNDALNNFLAKWVEIGLKKNGRGEEGADPLAGGSCFPA